MSWEHRPTAGVRVARLAFGSALLLAAWSLRQLLATEPLPVPGPRQVATELPHISSPEATPDNLLRLAVDQDPFRPDRRRPAIPFQFPGEALHPSRAAAQASAPVVALIGTAVLAEGKSFAMCQIAGEPPRLVRVGDRVGTYTLKAVTRGRATFVASDGSTYEVSVQKAGT